ncbi:unnamed protein product [Prorocentrum cordatum]|uniref:Major facilitator superfamily (MFS) profile domain-containing protein n=1 Tax=Prorocentrum cordatum TaxID=2364126 RepID=A0ABN9S7K0_9DINO|nr:unnamed protein product [Polarella glacialis]
MTGSRPAWRAAGVGPVGWAEHAGPAGASSWLATATVAVGGMLEWYDFAMFGFLVPEISAAFFPAASPTTSIIEACSVFGGAFLMRPLGGVFFGHVGDGGHAGVLSPHKALEDSLLAMAAPTVLLGCLPSHAQVGIAAPLLLVRLGQGIAVGGQLVRAWMLAELQAPPGWQNAYVCTSLSGCFLGSALGSAVNFVCRSVFSGKALLAWAWRVPFFFGAALPVAAYIAQVVMRPQEHGSMNLGDDDCDVRLESGEPGR